MSGKHCQKLLIVSTCTSAKYRIAKICHHTALIVHIRTARRLKQHVLFVTVTPDPDSHADAECTRAHKGEVQSRNADWGWPLGCTLMYPLLHQSWLATIKIQIEHYIFTADCLPNTLRCWRVKCQGVHLSSHPISLLQWDVWLKKRGPSSKTKAMQNKFQAFRLTASCAKTSITSPPPAPVSLALAPDLHKETPALWT